MRIRSYMTGTTPIMLHSDRLSDPDDPIVKQIRQITDKKKNQTEEDKKIVSKLEWFGALYTNGAKELVIPAANLIKLFRETGAITKDGTKIAKGVTPLALHFPLIHDGPKDLEKLFAAGPYVDRRPVGVGRSRIIRTRPIFPTWAIQADFEVLTDAINIDRASEIIVLGGISTGLGDARILGYGRYSAKVTPL